MIISTVKKILMFKKNVISKRNENMNVVKKNNY